MLAIRLSARFVSSLIPQDKYPGTSLSSQQTLSELLQTHVLCEQHWAPITIQFHAQPLICFQFADNDVVYFLVWVQLQIKLAPCNCVALYRVICSSEQHFDLTCIHACVVKGALYSRRDDFCLFQDSFPIPC